MIVDLGGADTLEQDCCFCGVSNGCNMVEFDGKTFQVAAKDLSKGLGLSEAQVMQGMRDGTITSLSERGVDEDEGCHRLTFFGPDRRMHLVVDGTGKILKRSSADFRRPVRKQTASANAVAPKTASEPKEQQE